METYVGVFAASLRARIQSSSNPEELRRKMLNLVSASRLTDTYGYIPIFILSLRRDNDQNDRCHFIGRVCSGCIFRSQQWLLLGRLDIPGIFMVLGVVPSLSIVSLGLLKGRFWGHAGVLREHVVLQVSRTLVLRSASEEYALCPFPQLNSSNEED